MFFICLKFSICGHEHSMSISPISHMALIVAIVQVIVTFNERGAFYGCNKSFNGSVII